MASPFHIVPATVLDGDSPLERTLAYHERSKHHLDRYAAGPGYLDWASQPDPFRRFLDAPVTPLPLSEDNVLTTYPDLYRPDAVPPAELSLGNLAAFLELSLGLSAWKSAGASRWALRCNPSSGNLHPTEGYVLSRGIEGLPDGVHHYAPHEHALECRSAANLPLPDHSFLVGLSSVFWREAWKYGERAYRYCNHDVGHAIAALWFAGRCQGWHMHLLDEAGDEDVSAALGLEREGDFDEAEREHPDALLCVHTSAETPMVDLDALVAAVRAGEWRGRANRLSESHRGWPVIEEVANAAARPRTHAAPPSGLAEPAEPVLADDIPAARIIRQRRSALGYDAETGLTRAAFLQMIDRIAARRGTPFEALRWVPRVHPVLMVHRVMGLDPGLYACVRDDGAAGPLRVAMRQEFAWDPVYEAPGVALYLLMEGDARSVARTVCCHQEIASDGMFSLGMLAAFGDTLVEAPWRYRELFWEAGALGQVLYLEAEALGARATGIGCYFDDAFHDLLGIEGHAFQSMYHFTIGQPVDDPRLQSHPPYEHLKSRTR